MVKSNVYIISILLMAITMALLSTSSHGFSIAGLRLGQGEIYGVLRCNISGDPNAPPVSGAPVYLKCDGSNTTIAEAVTNPDGTFRINSLIERGQLWRLATASVLHANPLHLMINCYSLNSIGPTAESLGGPKRFLAVYLTSADRSCEVLGSAMSYWLNKAPSVGASGAIFGLVLGSCICYKTQTDGQRWQ
ncbi:unnamed protein product [Arabidopsis arenosa]|uniref:Peptidase S54 rhomboid domain-containing protein n=1 Tax=Arabidopsis arenosa TaxID=38785 RepID=A0A8S1ZIN4_ARAAE|nr:unnamed protein product [Arabidopsis arenosa]